MEPNASQPAPEAPKIRENPFVSRTFRHRETPSFFRARWRNAGIGLGLLTFVGSVFAYTLHSVTQDDFKTYDEHGIKRVQQ